jgi:hypothetical protein
MSQKMKTRHASPSVVPVEAVPTLRILPLLACNLLSDSTVIL